MSRLPRFFISPEQVSGPLVTISGEDVRHIATVLRMKAGDSLLLCDGKGAEYTARISRLDRTEIKAEIVTTKQRGLRLPRITLGQGLPKSDKMDLIVQKATELDVSAIVPLVTERTIVKVRDEEKRISRWQKICREAAMQSSRVDIPSVEPIRKFSDFLRTLPAPSVCEPAASDYECVARIQAVRQRERRVDPSPRTLLLLPWEEGTTSIKNVLKQNSDVRNIIVLIGPEGGFSLSEAELARDKGFHLVSLGQNILRTETAAIAVLSMIGYELL
jgi:16S rRNA (uracil1498-N3)-methyltransferase